MKKQKLKQPSERLALYGYFVGLITIGTALLSLPLSWTGSGNAVSLSGIDAFFTAVSASCVTGLVTVDTADWSVFGQSVILFLIQAGGLGIATFGMLYLVRPRARVSLRNTKLIRDAFISETMPRARQMFRMILGITFFMEILGALLLLVAFSREGIARPLFAALFHSVSAFCNAGFSLFSEGLTGFRSSPLVNFTLMGLIVIGGLGFLVLSDLRRRLFNRRRHLLFHTRLMLMAVPLFIVVGFLGYWFLDTTGLFSSLPWKDRAMAVLFQSVTTRTAGFNTVNQADLSTPSVWLTLVLMLIGGGSGSTAGGIKVSTAFILILVLFHGVNDKGDIRIFRRRISSVDLSRAALFFLKAVAILFLSIVLLWILEKPEVSGFTQTQIAFECMSALGTVGLSMGITGELSIAGKLVIAATMFAGRVGLFSLVIHRVRDRSDVLFEYPKGEVLIG